jgi:NAD dependent epimerase/dehydratase family
MHRLLITGAAGTVGTILRNGLRGRLPVLRLLDVAPLGAAQQGEELVSADIRDLAAMVEATADVDAVIHLAGIPDEDSFQRILDVNMVGTYNLFEAARRQRAQRVVLASSAHVTGFYPTSQRIGPDVPPRPDTSTASARRSPRTLAVCMWTSTTWRWSACASAPSPTIPPPYGTSPPGSAPATPSTSSTAAWLPLTSASPSATALRQPPRLVGHHCRGAARLPPPRQRRALGRPARPDHRRRRRPRRRSPRRRLHPTTAARPRWLTCSPHHHRRIAG